MNILHKEDPFMIVGSVNDRSTAADSDYVWALKDIDFKVEQGDVVGIIGKNGAGKSTLLKLLSKVTGPTTGTINAKGRIASLLEVGTGFHSELTGRENIYMNGAILGMTKEEISRKLDEIVSFSGCERYIDTPVKRYSSGMTVRLGFAVAAHLDPEILVVDEVLAVGDAEFQKKAIGKMQDVSKGEGRTVLFVSHNMASIRQLCKTGVVLKNGSVDFIGGVGSAIDHYLHAYADSFNGMAIADIPRTDATSGIVKIVDVSYVNNNNEIITPHCGRPLRIKLKLQVRENVDACYLAIGIRNMLGDPMMSFPTNVIMDDFKITKGEHYAYLDIPKLPLTAGDYRVGIYCKASNILTTEECADYIDNVIRLKVEQDDFFANGKDIATHLMGKVVLCEYNWTIE